MIPAVGNTTGWTQSRSVTHSPTLGKRNIYMENVHFDLFNQCLYTGEHFQSDQDITRFDFMFVKPHNVFPLLSFNAYPLETGVRYVFPKVGEWVTQRDVSCRIMAGFVPRSTGGNIMTLSNGNIFRVTNPLWGESTGHRSIPLAKASDAELWFFIYPCTNDRANNREAGDLRHHRVHYDVTVMLLLVFKDRGKWSIFFSQFVI